MDLDYTFTTDYHCTYGLLEPVAPGLRRITANNPGPLTFRGTGTYVVGHGSVAVIDPGPADDNHIRAILEALSGEEISHILVTHTHRDHSAGVALLQQQCGAPSYSLGHHTAHQRPSVLPAELDAAGDLSFTPDITLNDGDSIKTDQWALQCLHTPGHASNHAAFVEKQHQRIFVGDLMMGWSTPVLLPPDGHLADYLSSLERVHKIANEHPSVELWPTHGGAINDANTLIPFLIQHRLKRAESVLQAVQNGHNTLVKIVEAAYPGLSDELKPAAMRSALASIIYLIEQKRLHGDLAQGLDIVCSAG